MSKLKAILKYSFLKDESGIWFFPFMILANTWFWGVFIPSFPRESILYMQQHYLGVLFGFIAGALTYISWIISKNSILRILSKI